MRLSGCVFPRSVCPRHWCLPPGASGLGGSSSISPAAGGAWPGHGTPSTLSRAVNPQACHSSECQLSSTLYYTEDRIKPRPRNQSWNPSSGSYSLCDLGQAADHSLLWFPYLCHGDDISTYLIGVS